MQSLLAQAQYLNLICADNITEISSTVLYLYAIAESIYRVIGVFRTQPIVKNAANTGGVDEVDENVSTDTVTRSFWRNEW